MARQRKIFSLEPRLTQSEVVHRLLKKSPKTCGEVVALTGFKHQSASARLNDLEKAGCVRRSGVKRSGSDVYEVVAGKTFANFQDWQRSKAGPSPRARLLQVCKANADRLRKGGAIRAEALEEIEREIFVLFP